MNVEQLALRTLMYPPDDYGCEFYLGDADVIGRACEGGRWVDLRNGSLTLGFVSFPRQVHSLDIVLLSRAIAAALQCPEVALDEYGREVAGDEGLWGAEAMPIEWVRLVAGIPELEVENVARTWGTVHDTEYEPESSDWLDQEVIDSLRILVSLCRRASAGKPELIHVWTL